MFYGGGTSLLGAAIHLLKCPPTLSVKLKDMSVEFPETNNQFQVNVRTT